MRLSATSVAGAGILAVFLQSPLPANGQSPGDGEPRLVAELAAAGGTLVLNVTFYRDMPTPDEAEQTLRHCLRAAAVVHPHENITARAWIGKTSDSSSRESIALTGGKEGLSYVANDQSIRATTSAATASSDVSEDVSKISKTKSVAEACQAVAKNQVSTLIAVALEKRAEKRRRILKAMRTWCKDKDVPRTKEMNGCISAISKAVVAERPMSAEPDDLAAVLARGEATFTGPSHCVKCHGKGGRGGPRAPNLSDDEWLHCDGSIEGIKKVILSGVSREELKDSSRPWPMKPATNLATNESELQDLATYVHSLSQK